MKEDLRSIDDALLLALWDTRCPLRWFAGDNAAEILNLRCFHLAPLPDLLRARICALQADGLLDVYPLSGNQPVDDARQRLSALSAESSDYLGVTRAGGEMWALRYRADFSRYWFITTGLEDAANQRERYTLHSVHGAFFELFLAFARAHPGCEIIEQDRLETYSPVWWKTLQRVHRLEIWVDESHANEFFENHPCIAWHDEWPLWPESKDA